MLDKTLFILVLIKLLSVSAYIDEYPTKQECSDRIHRECTHTTKYTEEDVDNARKWLQKRYAVTNPKLKPCTKLYVRKDIKCLSKNEVKDLIDVLKQLYANGIVSRFAEIHYNYWAAAHKFNEGPIWHWWFINEFEKEMRKINPKVTMPYWDFQTEFIGAEKSIVFDYFGHAGNADNDYCVTDGMLPNVKCNFPNTHCVRRQWNPNNTTPVWEPPEWVTAGMQMGVQRPIMGLVLLAFLQQIPQQFPIKLFQFLDLISDNIVPSQIYIQFVIFTALANHFKTHLSLGGWAGDLSVMYAPCDFVFYLLHEGLHVDYWKWSLQNDKNLVPQSYSLGYKFITESQTLRFADINTDTLAYYTNVTVVETFQIGFGEQCYIYDIFIKPINAIINKEKPKLPKAYYRLKSALPPKIFEKYFPKFALCPESVTLFDYDLENVGNCNPLIDGICRQMPIALNYSQTENGRRLIQKGFIEAGNHDVSISAGAGESFYVQFMKDLNTYGYCSPYA